MSRDIYMSDDFAYTYRYVIERFDNVVGLLGVEDGSIRKRLENAASRTPRSSFCEARP